MLPYLRSPASDPRFAVFFSREWAEALAVSSRNLLSSVFAVLPLPQLGRLARARSLETQVETLRARVAALTAELEAAQSSSSSAPPRPAPAPAPAASLRREGSGPPSEGALDASRAPPPTPPAPISPQPSPRPKEGRPPLNPSVHVFSGHASGITTCRFSPDGASVASASTDGTVRIWSAVTEGSSEGGSGPGSSGGAAGSPAGVASSTSTGPARAATLYCGSALGALAWEPRASRLLLLGTGQGGVRAWDAEAQRIVCQAPPREGGAHGGGPVLGLAASPDGTSFAMSTVDGLHFWSLRAFAPQGGALPAAAGGSRALSLAYNSTGRLLAAACADGVVRLYDCAGGGGRGAAPVGSPGGPAMSWQAGPGGACGALQFSGDGESVLSLGADGELCEWSLKSQATPLRRVRMLSPAPALDTEAAGKASAASPRFELSLHSDGRRALACGDGGAAAYMVELPAGAGSFGEVSSLDTGHEGACTSVDWHPSVPAALSGSADCSVRTLRC